MSFLFYSTVERWFVFFCGRNGRHPDQNKKYFKPPCICLGGICGSWSIVVTIFSYRYFSMYTRWKFVLSASWCSSSSFVFVVLSFLISPQPLFYQGAEARVVAKRNRYSFYAGDGKAIEAPNPSSPSPCHVPNYWRLTIDSSVHSMSYASNESSVCTTSACPPWPRIPKTIRTVRAPCTRRAGVVRLSRVIC